MTSHKVNRTLPLTPPTWTTSQINQSSSIANNTVGLKFHGRLCETRIREKLSCFNRRKILKRMLCSHMVARPTLPSIINKRTETSLKTRLAYVWLSIWTGRTSWGGRRQSLVDPPVVGWRCCWSIRLPLLQCRRRWPRSIRPPGSNYRVYYYWPTPLLAVEAAAPTAPKTTTKTPATRS